MPDAAQLSGVMDLVEMICREVLEVPSVNVEENLVNYGASSLTMIVIVTRLQDELKIEFEPAITAQLLFGNPSVRALSSYVAQAISGAGVPA